MSTAVTITTTRGKTTVDSPFHPNWPPAARAIGGDWKEGVWIFDARDEQRVRELARDIYGTDGTPDPGGTVTVRITIADVCGDKGGRPATLYRFGRTIATRFGRDTAPRLGEGVILITGGFAISAGSHNYIGLGPLEHTVVEVRDVPRSAVADDDGVSIVAESGTPDHEALRAERERLTARLAEIDAILDT